MRDMRMVVSLRAMAMVIQRDYKRVSNGLITRVDKHQTEIRKLATRLNPIQLLRERGAFRILVDMHPLQRVVFEAVPTRRTMAAKLTRNPEGKAVLLEQVRCTEFRNFGRASMSEQPRDLGFVHGELGEGFDAA